MVDAPIPYAHCYMPGAHWCEIVDRRTGAKITDVVEADALDGWVRRHVRDAAGHLERDGAAHKVELIELPIEIRLRPETPASWSQEDVARVGAQWRANPTWGEQAG